MAVLLVLTFRNRYSGPVAKKKKKKKKKKIAKTIARQVLIVKLNFIK